MCFATKEHAETSHAHTTSSSAVQASFNPTNEKSSATQLMGATTGSSKMEFGVPKAKAGELKLVVSSQSVERFVIVYPQPMVEPGAPVRLIPGNQLRSAHANAPSPRPALQLGKMLSFYIVPLVLPSEFFDDYLSARDFRKPKRGFRKHSAMKYLATATVAVFPVTQGAIALLSPSDLDAQLRKAEAQTDQLASLVANSRMNSSSFCGCSGFIYGNSNEQIARNQSSPAAVLFI